MKTTLVSSDTYFVQVPTAYASVDECLANAPDPRTCQFAIALCKNGRAGLRTGDGVEDGTYSMTGRVANAWFDPQSFNLNVDTGISDGEAAGT
jgi:hypothetical protein